MLIHCDRRATTKTGPFRPKAGTNMGVNATSVLSVQFIAQ